MLTDAGADGLTTKIGSVGIVLNRFRAHDKNVAPVCGLRAANIILFVHFSLPQEKEQHVLDYPGFLDFATVVHEHVTALRHWSPKTKKYAEITERTMEMATTTYPRPDEDSAYPTHTATTRHKGETRAKDGEGTGHHGGGEKMDKELVGVGDDCRHGSGSTAGGAANTVQTQTANAYAKEESDRLSGRSVQENIKTGDISRKVGTISNCTVSNSHYSRRDSQIQQNELTLKAPKSGAVEVSHAGLTYCVSHDSNCHQLDQTPWLSWDFINRGATRHNRGLINDGPISGPTNVTDGVVIEVEGCHVDDMLARNVKRRDEEPAVNRTYGKGIREQEQTSINELFAFQTDRVVRVLDDLF